jgi:hypothetical protein
MELALNEPGEAFELAGIQPKARAQKVSGLVAHGVRGGADPARSGSAVHAQESANAVDAQPIVVVQAEHPHVLRVEHRDRFLDRLLELALVSILEVVELGV